MIKLIGFKKKYFKDTILEIDRLDFDKTGFYLIYGRSGCGKTTLLNSLSLLDDQFEGELLIKGKAISNLNDNEKSDLRSKLISYVHQKPVLLNDFSVLENIKLFSNLKEGEIINYLNRFKLGDKKKTKIRELSGGEKQRVSLIKVLVQSTPIILADEPTGALDRENSEFVISKLKELSKTKLVIVVSHDLQLFKSYADEIINIKNKKAFIERKKIKSLENKRNFVPSNEFSKKKIRSKYSSRIIKRRRFKNGLLTFFTSLSIICISLTMLISFNVKESLLNGFSSFYEPNQVVVQRKNQLKNNFRKNTPNNEEIFKIKEYLNLEEEPRYFYSNNLETFFKDGNSLHLVTKYRTHQIEGFSARNFNEFKLKNTADSKYFSKNDLNNDEIIISMDNQRMLDFCYYLSIEKTFKSLFTYISNNDVYVSLFIKNFDREYEDEQIFKIVGFVVETQNNVYHDNPSFAQELFEKSMKLPATIYDEVQEYPWYLKKEIIFNLNSIDKDLFYYDDFLSNFYIEKLKYADFASFYEKNTLKNDGLYKVYKKSSDDLIRGIDLKWLNENNYDFFLSNDSYIKNSILSGFVNEIFLASNREDLSYVEDNYFKSDIVGKIAVEDKLNILSGGLLVESKNRFSLKKLDEFNATLTDNEIVVSSKLYNFFEKTLQNSTIFLISLTERYTNGKKIIKEYVKNELKISSVIPNDDECIIYGNEYLICNLFRDYLGVEYQKYSGSAVNLSVNDEKSKETLHKYFYKFDVSEPFKEINKQIDDIIFILQIILSFFSLIVICISILLLSLILKSFIYDFREDLFNLYCFGVSKKEIGKIFKTYTMKLFLKATIMMAIFNFSMSFLISFIVSSSLNTSFKFVFSAYSFIASILLIIFMYILSISFVNKFIKSENVVISIRN